MHLYMQTAAYGPCLSEPAWCLPVKGTSQRLKEQEGAIIHTRLHEMRSTDTPPQSC